MGLSPKACDELAIVVEQPPRTGMGDYALPLAYELIKQAKRHNPEAFLSYSRKAPLQITQDVAEGVGPIEGFKSLQPKFAYINAYVDRGYLATKLIADHKPSPNIPTGKVLVEHSSINPNKAAHIGHLRNAILGDTFVRLLRFAGREVDVQNYIDNTGVQVADVVVGFSANEISVYQLKQLIDKPGYEHSFLFHPSRTIPWPLPNPWPTARFDYLCWDLYAATSQWYETHPEEGRHLRDKVLHAMEGGKNQYAEMADLISVAVLKRHVETMDRLDIKYDFLPRESEILHLHFWDAAFTKLKQSGVLSLETQGKNKGCWVMRRPDTGSAEDTRKVELQKEDLLVDTYPSRAGETGVRVRHIPTGAEAASEGEGSQEANYECAVNRLLPRVREIECQKVIVRSNKTVGYVGKDIAYHMWKFGLLGRDFGYRKFHYYERDSEGHFLPKGHWCWISTVDGEKKHPHFGDVAEIYNVIDARQSEAQNTVLEALRGLGHDEAADRYTHFSYEMVALTPRCAAELGYQLSDEDKQRSWIEVSGRKGFGVKADDLLDALITSARKEVDERHPGLSEAERGGIATQIAIGALRYFMLKFTKPSVIAFDFKDALSFEGDTGPYAQYAVVRASNIFRKGGLDPEGFCRDSAGRASLASGSAGAGGDEASLVPTADFAKYLNGESSDDIWELWLAAAKTSYIVSQCIAATEPAYLAKHTFQLAQLFNTFYHRYPILSEADEGRRRFLLTTAAVVRRELIRVLAIMGISVPPVM
jgi:arginyl-tRNA synthetase